MANLEHYKTFMKVAELKNMTKAAEELYVSQPAVTQTIKALEWELGGPLFIRTKKSIELTKEGQMLYERLKTALQIIKDAELEFGQYNELKKGEIRIGASSTLSKILLEDKIIGFREKYPGIKVVIENGVTSSYISLMQKGLLDVCFFSGDTMDLNNPAMTGAKKIDSLKYCFIYNPEFFQCNTIEECMECPLIIQKKGSNTREAIDAFFTSKGKKVEPAVEAVANSIIISLVAGGLGVGCVYEKLADMDDRIKKVPGNAPITADIYMASHDVAMQTAATKAFISFMEET